MECTLLTNEQLRIFVEEGYLIVREALDEETLGRRVRARR